MHECQSLQQLHILLVFQQRSVQGRYRFSLITVFEDLIGNVVRHHDTLVDVAFRTLPHKVVSRRAC